MKRDDQNNGSTLACGRVIALASPVTRHCQQLWNWSRRVNVSRFVLIPEIIGYIVNGSRIMVFMKLQCFKNDRLVLKRWPKANFDFY
ncbi:hypothetical protein TNCT_138201 [Trichonephila clavata]|uniref:Uncharacterized protein n=1 Tax=Trichonephila clavata TaxID=2740835 RepID=A0A8X6GLV0_TRICU|nr:hypothetical protein TNCT_138201 [Trichonephila clavata]